MPLTRHTSAIQRFRIRSSRFRVRASARSNSGASPRRRIHRRPLWVHGSTEIPPRSNRRGPVVAFASALAAAVEHEVKQRQLIRCSGAQKRFKQCRRQRAGPRVDRALHGSAWTPREAASSRRRDARLRRRECSYIWVETSAGLTSWQNVRPDVARIERGGHARQRVRRVWRRVLPHFGLQQPGKCRGSGAAFENSAKLVTQTISSANRIHARLDCLRYTSRVECAKFFGDHLACRNENKICHSFIAFVS